MRIRKQPLFSKNKSRRHIPKSGCPAVSLKENDASWRGKCRQVLLEALETGPKGQPELAKYTTVKFTNCAAVTVKAKTLYPDQGNTINMVNSSGAVISKGTDVGKREVDVSYV